MNFARGVAFKILNAGWKCIAQRLMRHQIGQGVLRKDFNWFIKKHGVQDKYKR